MVEIKRDVYLKRLIARKGNGRAKIITGIRRCGKSYLLFKLFKKHLIENDGIDEGRIIEFSLDHEKNEHLLDRHALASEIRGRIKDGGKWFVFLDEIQNVEGFEFVVNGLLGEPNIDVYITGSNSKFLSSDVITEFRGRGDEVRVLPLSFAEIRPLYGSDEEAWEDYFNYGGLPSIYAEGMDDEQKIAFLSYVSNVIYLKDVTERNRLKGEENIGVILDLLASADGSFTNPLKLANTFRSKRLSSVTDKTVANYLRILEDAFLIERARRFDIKGKAYIDSPFKFYFTDLGVRNSRLNFRQVEETHVMENIIYNELRLRGFAVDVGLVHKGEKDDSGKYKDRQYEVDFVANRGPNRFYIQSALTLLDEDKLRRELRSLSLIGDSFSKILVTRDRIKPRRTEDGILALNLFDFLLNPGLLS